MKFTGRLLIAATLLFTLGCAKADWIDRTLVTETVTGVWAGSMVSPDGQPMISSAVRLELQQEGAKVVGSFQGTDTGSYVGRGSTAIEGSVAGDVFRFNDPRGTLNGELTVSGDEMIGQGIFGTRRVAITLRRGDSSSQQGPPPR